MWGNRKLAGYLSQTKIVLASLHQISTTFKINLENKICDLRQVSTSLEKGRTTDIVVNYGILGTEIVYYSVFVGRQPLLLQMPHCTPSSYATAALHALDSSARLN